jgi:hypothetical protein
VARDAPPDTKVLRDGVELGVVSLGTPLRAEVGAHVLVARGGGLEREYRVVLMEGEMQEIEVRPAEKKPMVPAVEASPASKERFPAPQSASAETVLSDKPSESLGAPGAPMTVEHAVFGIGMAGTLMESLLRQAGRALVVSYLSLILMGAILIFVSLIYVWRLRK